NLRNCSNVASYLLVCTMNSARLMSPLFQFIKAVQIFVFFLCSMLMGWAQAGNEMKNLTILAYHEVTSEPQPLMPEYAIDPEQLQQHLDWLVQNGFQF